MNFKIKHFGNLLVRLFTFDKYYVCEECHRIHKRDGREIRLDTPIAFLRSNKFWYGSVSRQCFIEQQRKVVDMLSDSLLNELTKKGE